MAKFEKDMQQLAEVFVYETSDLLAKLDDILIKTESGELSADDVNEIFRIMHTVKGSAAMMGLKSMSELAHALEDLFSIIRDKPSISPDKAELYEILYSGLDSLKGEVDRLFDENAPLSDFSGEIQMARKFAESLKPSSDKPELSNEKTETLKPADGAAVFKVEYDENCAMPDMRAMVLLNQLKGSAEVLSHIPENLDDENAADAIRQNGFLISVKCEDTDVILTKLKSGINVKTVSVQKSQPKKEAVQNTKPAPENIPETQTAPRHVSKFISVKLEKLDRLMRIAQEIVIAQSGVLHNKELEPYRKNMPSFEKAANDLRKLTDELQDTVMSVRMVPIKQSFGAMNRVVRDMNKTLGKNIELVFEGEQCEIDKSAADLLGDPLMHLVRNAADHGIESPEERTASGKTEPARITLSAWYESNAAVISVTDNGRGMDAALILEKARQKRILDRAQSDYTQQQAFELILHPGFSTNSTVTEYSGRGVGMDVVKKNIERMGGALSIESKKDEGSRFIIRIPLSISVSECLGFTLGGEEYAVLTSSVSDIFRAERKDIVITPDGKEAVMSQHSRDKKLLKVIRLSEHFRLSHEKKPLYDGIMLDVKTKNGEAALFCDTVSEDMQLVIKPFSPFLSSFGLKEKGLLGTSVLGDGRVIPIISAEDILTKEGAQSE